ncbi:MAG: ABC transporter permease [Paeniglutamicibacter terrestris]|jgi:peptide/nickel transport system permease protein|uniref:ABC transporter permease n=1 Tax=Paeniglutamicibacter terrestris TaxID=2723403 RepID=A0ABX1G8C1_9MICC|nr:ABC transporter permease [Paeniglutamicibacter terrestris]NKG22268.1 ABC transporter permease [Paeniglutamicibacter terrestris]
MATTINLTENPAVTPPPTRPAAKAGGSFARYLLTRFLLIFPTIFILVTLVFFLMRVTGDPITAALGGRLTPDQLAERISAAGYDRPVIVQYFEYLGQIFTGNFGRTISDNRAVTEVLATYGAATAELAVNSLIVALLIGIPFGLLAAKMRDRWPDALLRVFAILCYATPVFFAGLLLKLIFGVWLGWLPIAGRAGVNAELQLTGLQNPSGIFLLDALRSGNMSAASDVISHAILPAVALGLLTAGVFLRLVRTNVIGTLGRDYVEAGRSRGVSEYRLLTKHAYRPALIPIITVMGLQIALLLGGAVLTETTFEWKGLGFQLAQYLTARDFVAVQGIVVLLAVIVALTNFIVDIIAALIDPRVRF